MPDQKSGKARQRQTSGKVPANPLGTLSVARTGPFLSGRSRDHEDLDDLLSELQVAEIIGVQTDWEYCFGGVADALVVDHSFEVGLIPEPATALLLALGLVALAKHRRQRGG